MNEIFSYLPGNIIIHKIALLSKNVRQVLKDKKDQVTGRLVTLKVNDTRVPKDIVENGSCFESEWKANEKINWSAVRKLLQFTNGVKLVMTDGNF